MTVLADHEIRAYVHQYRMIEPFQPELVRRGRISYGVSSYGYDLRLANEFHRVIETEVLDPKRPETFRLERFRARAFVLEPGETVLARSLEYFRIPRRILVLVQGKSTYARCGLVVNVTPLEPEWEGYITMALANCGRSPLRVHAEEGIAQAIFLRADRLCRTSYRDRGGKYQGQERVEPPRV